MYLYVYYGSQVKFLTLIKMGNIMATKGVTISARISHEDAEFLSALTINGAKTPSDKLRSIITEARQRAHRPNDYAGCFQMVQEIIMPIIEQVRQTEIENNIHSELFNRTVECLSDTLAFLLSATSSPDNKIEVESLKSIEQGIADRIFRLFESIMQMGIIKRSTCYDSSLIQDRIETVLDLCEVIINNKQQ